MISRIVFLELLITGNASQFVARKYNHTFEFVSASKTSHHTHDMGREMEE